MASRAEEFILKLTQQVSGPAAVATSALVQLEATIAAEKAALGGLEEKLGVASAKLATLGEGVDGKVSIAAIRKQQAAVAALQAQIDQSGAGVAALEGARGLASQADAAKAASVAAAQAAVEAAAQEAAAQKAAAAEAAAGKAAAAQAAAESAAATKAAAAAAGELAAQEAAAAAAARDLAAANAAVAAAAAKVAAAEAAEDAATEAKFASLSATYQQAEAERKLADAAKAAAGALKAEASAAAQATKHASDMAKSLPTGQVNVLSEAFGRLGGPVGRVGQKVFGAADAFKKLGVAGGGSFAIAAVGAVAFVAVLAGAAFGLYKITSQLIEWADTTGQLGKLQEKFSKNLKETFGGAVKIDGFLGALGTLVNLFDKSTASGKALGFITGLIFQPLIDMATAAIPHIERAFVVLLTWALKAYVAVKQFAASDIGQGLILGLKIVAVVLGVVLALAAVGVALLALPFLVMGAAVLAAVAAVGYVINAVSGVLSYVAGLPGKLADIGANMMAALAGAITGAAGAVLGAITGAVGGAIDAAKALLGISSPSKVFANIGLNIGAGAEAGLDKAAPGVQESMVAMAAPPRALVGASAGGTAAAASGPTLLAQFTNCVFGEGLSEEIVDAMLARAFERYSGAVEAPA